MDILLVRHGESEGNVLGQLQGIVDSPLTDLGRAQARRLGNWLKVRGLRWSAAYASPLARARDTAGVLAEITGFPRPTLDDDLREVGAGALEGLTREQIFKKYPRYIERGITDLGDFGEFGGESYDDVQARVRRMLVKIEAKHRAGADTILVVAHGGINFQMVKSVVCVPVPRVCILHWGNCTAALLRFRDRRGAYMADVAWHIPTELMGGETHEAATGIFR